MYRYDPYHAMDYGLGDAETFQNNVTREAPISPMAALAPSSISAAFSLPTSLLQPPLLAAIPPLIQSVNVPQPFSNSSSTGKIQLNIIMLCN